MLARMAVREDPPSRVRQLLAGGVAWLGKQVSPHGFPAHTLDGQRVPGQRVPGRTAWCYGDAGVVAALHGLVPSPLWTTRTREQALVRDDGFCHGAAGLTHIANRRYQQTRSLEYQTVARVWVEQLFAYQRPDAGVGGFGHEQEGPRRASILGGSAGIGLVLLALLSDVEPAWDRKLLCDDLDH